jgi:spore germination protein GerM
MKIILEKRSVILIIILAVLLITSMTAFFIADNNLVRRVMFFPGQKNISGEMRRIPRQETLEDDIKLFVKELILGPYSIDHLRLIPENTELQNLLLRNKSLLYIDFSADFVIRDNNLSLITSDTISLIRKNLKYNFPILEEIRLSIDGQSL